jgi:hypothetical protein
MIALGKQMQTVLLTTCQIVYLSTGKQLKAGKDRN